MREDPHVTMTLAIADSPSDLQVIGVNGRDRLNAPFHFDIDLVSRHCALDCAALLHREAYLQIGVNTDNALSVQGQVQAVRQLCHGTDLSLYRLQLMPALQRLDGPLRRAVFNGLSVPQILERLLSAHGMEAGAFRFDHLIGLYPAREHCVQYDESDLHLLRRLCEEEGISFRFEHHPHHHVLVFSDDPAGFPEWPSTARVDHLAERFSIRTCYNSHLGEDYCPSRFMPARDVLDADNQAHWPANPADVTPGRRQQLSNRRLERLRCERREIIGHSDLAWLRAGLVTRVDGHPETLFNDQWLVTDVFHSARQLAPLRGCASADIARILRAIANPGPAPSATTPQPARRTAGGRPAIASYANGFRVIPWTMPFRPSVEHPKPTIVDTSHATQTDEAADPQGRVRIRYGWQEPTADPENDSWARVVSDLGPYPPKTLLQVRFFDGDPDQPLVCGTLVEDPVRPPNREQPLEGTAPSAAQAATKMPLRIDSPTPLLLKSPLATLRISENGIHFALREACGAKPDSTD